MSYVNVHGEGATPYQLGYGVDLLTGEVAGKAAEFSEKFEQDAPLATNVDFKAEVIHSAEEFERHIEAEFGAKGSYKIFSASADAQYAMQSKINQRSTYIVITGMLEKTIKRIDGTLAQEGKAIVTGDNADSLFRRKYGDRYVRGVIEGGVLFALISIRTEDKHMQREIAVALKGKIKGIASAETTYKDILKKTKHELYVDISISQTGGTNIAPGLISLGDNFEKLEKIMTSFYKEALTAPWPLRYELARYHALKGFPAALELTELSEKLAMMRQYHKLYVILTGHIRDVEQVLNFPGEYVDPPDPLVLREWLAFFREQLEGLLAQAHEFANFKDIGEPMVALLTPDGFRLPLHVSYVSAEEAKLLGYKWRAVENSKWLGIWTLGNEGGRYFNAAWGWEGGPASVFATLRIRINGDDIQIHRVDRQSSSTAEYRGTFLDDKKEEVGGTYTTDGTGTRVMKWRAQIFRPAPVSATRDVVSTHENGAESSAGFTKGRAGTV